MCQSRRNMNFVLDDGVTESESIRRHRHPKAEYVERVMPPRLEFAVLNSATALMLYRGSPEWTSDRSPYVHDIAPDMPLVLGLCDARSNVT